MNIIIILAVLAALGLLGFLAKSIIAVFFGAVGFAVSFLVYCASTLFSILGNIFVFVLSIAAFAAAIVFIPALLIVIIPGICLAYSYARRKSSYGPA